MAFVLKQRPVGAFWEHDTAPVWIVKYDAIPDVRAEHWKAYKAVERVPAGRAPYSVDNKVIGSVRGFNSLEEAKFYCERLIELGTA